MRFGTRHKLIDRAAIRTGRKPFGERHGRHVGLAEKRIDAPGDQRHGKDRNESQQSAWCSLACGFRSFLA